MVGALLSKWFETCKEGNKTWYQGPGTNYGWIAFTVTELGQYAGRVNSVIRLFPSRTSLKVIDYRFQLQMAAMGPNDRMKRLYEHAMEHSDSDLSRGRNFHSYAGPNYCCVGSLQGCKSEILDCVYKYLGIRFTICLVFGVIYKHSRM